MRVTYKTSNGILNCWLGHFGFIEVYDDKWNVVADYRFEGTSEDPTFTHNGEVIHVNNFEYYGIDELITRLDRYRNPKTEEDKRFMFHDRFLETLVKDTENVGIVGKFECYNTMLPLFGIGFKGSGSTSIECLMVPFEDRYKKSNWYYKVQFRPEDANLRLAIGSETWYLSDLSSMIETGYYTLVNAKKYREEHPDDGVDLSSIECLII